MLEEEKFSVIRTIDYLEVTKLHNFTYEVINRETFKQLFSELIFVKMYQSSF